MKNAEPRVDLSRNLPAVGQVAGLQMLLADMLALWQIMPGLANQLPRDCNRPDMRFDSMPI
jgi:hypothetical protein